ncbi:MAG TPA: hypothetical protein VIA62_16315 [Thermoanaerobaculia bacterium]|jgi:hypothetical protein|nr:hypothetical protein [Thermoanaerobaculia bacterium]
MRSSRPLPVLAWLVLGFLALASAGLAREADAPVRLVAPRAGATFAAGSTAELEWAPLARFARLPGIEEWEAFLSLDGGATYPVRITPHLDQDLRRIRFQVPAVPTTNARILLRFGDERRETVVELPERFEITAPPLALPVWETSHRAFTVGEPALPGQAGVVAWVEGSRRGGGLRQVVAAERPGLQARPDLTATHGEAAVLVSGPAPPQPPGRLPVTRVAAGPSAGRAALSRAGTGPSLGLDILLLTQRQNE